MRSCRDRFSSRHLLLATPCSTGALPGVALPLRYAASAVTNARPDMMVVARVMTCVIFHFGCVKRVITRRQFNRTIRPSMAAEKGCGKPWT